MDLLFMVDFSGGVGGTKVAEVVVTLVVDE